MHAIHVLGYWQKPAGWGYESLKVGEVGSWAWKIIVLINFGKGVGYGTSVDSWEPENFMFSLWG